jgi:Flagellar capping protein
MSDITRITGQASGLDVDTIVKQMMKADNVKLDELKQSRQYTQWEQDAYRDIMGDINTFRSTYFDLLKPDTNMLSQNSYAVFDITSSEAMIASATAGAGAEAGTYMVNFNHDDAHLAQAAGARSNERVVTLLNEYASESDKLTELGASSTSHTISITYNNGSGTITKSVALTGSSTIKDIENSISSATSGQVVAKFSELTGKFTIQTQTTGANTSLSITSDSSLLSALKLYSGTYSDSVTVDKNSAGYAVEARNAVVYITPPNGTEVRVEKSKNNFAIDGVNYSLLNAVDNDGNKSTNITVTSNTQKTFDKIKTFIDKYNEVITNIQDKLNEKKDYNYKPLTDDQKENMSDEQIKKWEDKAKQGILKNDASLQSMVYRIRSAFFEEVEGTGISLTDIGLSTSTDYDEGGKIVIDEIKLKHAIQNRGGQLANLFSQNCSIAYDPDHKTDKDRYKQVGIFQRVQDIFKDYVRTSRDSNGNKGLIVQKAGVVGDMSEVTSELAKELRDDYDKRITEMTKKLAEKENRYYQQYSQLEATMQKLNSQQSWLTQQLGLGGNN